MAPIFLDPNADTMVRVIQRGPVTFKQTDMKVLAAALSECRYWESFIRHMNGTSGFMPNNTHVEDTGITVVAVEIVLRGLHQAYHHRQSHSGGSNEGDANSVEGQVTNNESVTAGDGGAVPPLGPTDVDVYFPHELFKADIDDVWGVLALVNLDTVGKSHKGKFDVDRTVVESWFLKWRETSFATFNTQTDFEKVIFPTFAFGDTKGFQLATKWLCQRTSVGNIAEYSPLVHSQGTQWYLHLHLPARVMGKFSAFFGIFPCHALTEKQPRFVSPVANSGSGSARKFGPSFVAMTAGSCTVTSAPAG